MDKPKKKEYLTPVICPFCNKNSNSNEKAHNQAIEEMDKWHDRVLEPIRKWEKGDNCLVAELAIKDTLRMADGR